ncbi:hypothetical protein DFJ73DRAFT_757349 [Zopfochytrium polystomum]|nr:hypothetical protein DFJ73DRAFT_757349 [Zopfochytrium polystomum]
MDPLHQHQQQQQQQRERNTGSSSDAFLVSPSIPPSSRSHAGVMSTQPQQQQRLASAASGFTSSSADFLVHPTNDDNPFTSSSSIFPSSAGPTSPAHFFAAATASSQLPSGSSNQGSGQYDQRRSLLPEADVQLDISPTFSDNFGDVGSLQSAAFRPPLAPASLNPPAASRVVSPLRRFAQAGGVDEPIDQSNELTMNSIQLEALRNMLTRSETPVPKTDRTGEVSNFTREGKGSAVPDHASTDLGIPVVRPMPRSPLSNSSSAGDVRTQSLQPGRDEGLRLRGSTSALSDLVTPKVAANGAARQPNTQTCSLCDRPLPRPIESQTVEIQGLKPRFLRELKRMYPLRVFHKLDRICVKDLHILLQKRIDKLLEEDQTELSRLQDDAMKNLGAYEQQEQNWQKQFETGWTIWEKAADLVAKFGGSWRFIFSLLGFLACWMLINGISGNLGGFAWDPYPFILLNLFLSTLAALQAPVIMMSQNRQAQIDRLQNDYVSKIVLRAEHQVRHVNAKLDHLLSHQWKRLLEIQQTQTDLLQLLQAESRQLTTHRSQLDVGKSTVASSIPLSPNAVPVRPGVGGLYPQSPNFIPMLPQPANRAGRQFQWSTETQPDDHMRMLLGHHFGSVKGEHDDTLIFAHWHTDGDNYFGLLENVRFEVRYPGVIKRVTYDIVLNDPTASLDDIFAGEGTITLRNDMDVPHMEMQGRILRLEIHSRDKSSAPVVFANGDLPSRYKSTFFLKRDDKITDFWKAPLSRVTLTYSPPHQTAVFHLRAGQRVSGSVRVDFFPSAGVEKAKLFMRKMSTSNWAVGGSGFPGDETPYPRYRKSNSRHRDQSRNALTQEDEVGKEILLAAIGRSSTVTSTTSDSSSGSDSSSNSRPRTDELPGNQDQKTSHIPDPLEHLRDVLGPRPLPSDRWRVVAHAVWPENSVPGWSTAAATVIGQATPVAPRIGPLSGPGDEVSVMLGTGAGGDVVLSEAVPVTVLLPVNPDDPMEGPATYVFVCDETRVAFHAMVEEQ